MVLHLNVFQAPARLQTALQVIARIAEAVFLQISIQILITAENAIMFVISPMQLLISATMAIVRPVPVVTMQAHSFTWQVAGVLWV